MLNPAHAAARITFDAQFAKARGQSIDQQQATHQRLAKTSQQFQRFKSLQAADQTNQRTDHAGFTAGQLRLAAMTIQTVIAGAIGPARIENRPADASAETKATDSSKTS